MKISKKPKTVAINGRLGSDKLLLTLTKLDLRIEQNVKDKKILILNIN